MKIETTDNFFHSQFPKHRRLTPRVHPIHRPPHAQGLAVLLMITDCKIKLVECGSCPWSHRPFICSAFFFPLCEATDQCKPCSLLQPTPPPPLQEATKYYFRWLEGPARAPTCCKWHARNTRWNYKGLVFTKLGDLASKSSQMLSLSGNIFLPLF